MFIPRYSRRLKISVAVFLAVSIGTGIVSANAASQSSGFVTRNGSKLVLDGNNFRFAGANMYWLGLDEEVRDSSGNPSYPSKARIEDGFASAKAMNATVVRSHTLGVSVGCANCLEPSLGNFNDAAFDSIDYSIAQASKNNIKLMIPLTDQWRWYHGGKSVFTGWLGYPNVDGANSGNNETQKANEAHFYTDPKVIAAYEAYISHLLNHKNAYTGVALKDDPTIMAWETGNEIWDAPPAWTEQIASFIKKDLGAKQLVADGGAANGNTVSKAAIDAPSVDIVGGHFYPRDINWMNSDAAIAKAHNKAYIVGEYDWATDPGSLGTFLTAVQSNSAIAGDMFWSIFPHLADGTPEQHGDGFTMHVPASTSQQSAAAPLLTAHGAAMHPGTAAATTTTAKPATTTTTAPVTTTTAKPAVTTTTAAPQVTTTTAKPAVAVTPTTVTPAVASGTSVDDSSSFLKYSGTWNTGDGSAKFNGKDHYSDAKGASVSASFTGTQVQVRGAQASWHGKASVSIDGKPTATIDYYNANRADDVVLYTSPKLASGTHTVAISVLGDKNAKSTGTVVTLDRLALSVAAAPIAPTTSASTSVDDSASSVQYSGTWNTGDGSAKFNGRDHYSDQKNATIKAIFTGTQVKLHAAQAPWHGKASVSVDGGPTTTVDFYSANRSDDVTLFTSSKLAKGTHTITVKVLAQKSSNSTGNVVTLDRLEVLGG